MPSVSLKDGSYEGEYSFVVTSIGLCKGTKEGTINLYIHLLATSIDDTSVNYVYEEERPLFGLKNLGELKMEFVKAKGYEIAKANKSSLFPELMSDLASKGWTKQKLMMNYRPSKMVKKLAHIIRDSQLNDWFYSVQLNPLALVGKTINAKLSERGALMSLSGESQERDDYQSTPSQDNMMVDDTSFSFGKS